MPDDLPREFRASRKIIDDKMAESNQLKTRKASRYANELSNPCLKESESSMKCMSDSGYDRDECSLHFQNYKNCKDFWSRVQRDRRAMGVKPYLPIPEERAEAQVKYRAKWLRR